MALTNTEATAVNILVRWLVNEPSVGTVPSSHDAKRAAEVLVDHANKTLMAGLRPEQILDLWPRPNSDGELVFKVAE